MRSSTYARRSGRATPSPQPRRADESQLDLRRRFTDAIARPGASALLITPDNTNGGWVTIADAVASQRAFAVELADDILGIDCDDPARRHVVEELAARCHRTGVQPVIANSGQPGRLHLFARVPDTSIRSQLAEFARTRGLDVRHSIRPPLAPHRLGLPTSLVTPTEPADALAALAPHRRVRRLSRRMRRLLRHGDTEGRYASRSEVVAALTLAAVNEHWSEKRLYWTLSDHRNIGGQKVQEIAASQGDREAERYVRCCWNAAVNYAAMNPPISTYAEVQAMVTALLDAADRCPWPGIAGGTDRVVLDAHAAIAAALGTLVYGASVRQIAELAGVAYPTVSIAHGRLRKAGWLRRVAHHRGPHPDTWKLCTEKACKP